MNQIYTKALAFAKRHNLSCDIFDFEKCCRDYCDEMEKGLVSKSSFEMLPTYIEMGHKIPLNKKVIVIDAGGTSLRIATVYFDDSESAVIENFCKYKMPGTYGKITAEKFFETLAKYLEPVIDMSDTIAFCFSFTTETLPNKDAKVMFLGKQIEITGLIGQTLTEQLNKQFKTPKRVVVLNDAVASLLGGAGREISKNLYDYYIGFILGTGTNTCYLEENRNIKKLCPAMSSGSMVVNMESGGYSGFMRSDIDIAFDSTTHDPGVFPFEKVIGGKYEGGLFLTLLKTAANEGFFSAHFKEKINALDELPSFFIDKFAEAPLGDNLLSECCERNDEGNRDREMVFDLVDLFYDRSALLIAINFSSIILRSGKGKNPIKPVLIVIEGSTILNSIMLRTKVERNLDKLLTEKSGVYYRLTKIENANIIGTAIAGLTN